MTTARPARARHAAPGTFPAGRRRHTPATATAVQGTTTGRHVARHAARQHAPQQAPALRRPAVAVSLPSDWAQLPTVSAPVRTGGSVRISRPVRGAIGRAVLATGAAGAVALPVVATVLTPTPGAANAEAASAGRVMTESVALSSVTSAGVPADSAAWVAAAQSVQDAAVGAQIAAAGQQAAAEQAAAQVAQAAAAQAAVVQAQQVEAQRAADVAAAQARASRSRTPLPVAAPAGDPRAIAAGMLAARGWGGQMSCLDRLWTKESGWKTTADNPSSSAYGIPQALPGSKMASAGPDWRTNPATQISWGLGYIASRYGSPCAAWSHSQSVNWY